MSGSLVVLILLALFAESQVITYVYRDFRLLWKWMTCLLQRWRKPTTN
jgi:hypothetical protein